MTPEEQRQFQIRQRSRNKALGFVLVGLVVLFFALTVVRFPDAEDRAAAAAAEQGE